MNRLTVSLAVVLSVVLATGLFAARKAEGDSAANGPERGLKIVVASDAAPAVREAAQEIAAAANTSPLLQVLSNGKQPQTVSSEELAKARPEDRAFTHLILVGLPDDPIIQQTWLRDARAITVDGATGLYVFGFGNLLGDLGYIESDRNPFLHGAAIRQAPYETEFVTISGSTPAGVKLAADAFLKQGLINGVVSSDWKRGQTTLLDRDPLPPGTGAGDVLPAQVGNWKLIGITQASEDEYRGVLADTGVEPQVIWRGKYYSPGAWDGAGQAHALQDFSAGLHRRAYGNSVWAAQFASESVASDAAAKIAAAAHLKKQGSEWTGKQGPLSSEKDSAGPLKLQQHGAWLLMSTVPGGE